LAVFAVKCPIRGECYQSLKRDLMGCEEGLVVEGLRLFSMDGEDKQAEVCLMLAFEHSAEEQMLLMKRAKECCEAYGISEVIIQIRYEIK